MTVETTLRENLGTAKQTAGLKRRAKIIAADVWGSTAYYPAEVLERDGSRVFVAGTQMFEDHLTESEEWEKPEGKVGNLVGKLISDAVYEAAGEDGPGLYADVEFYESYGTRINEIAGDIGLSVRASGITEYAEMDGREGPVLVALLAASSVDVVTKAGAGGKLTSILESHRDLAGRPITKEGTEALADVTKEDFEALKASLTESIDGLLAGLKEALTPAAVVEETPEAKAEREVAEKAAAAEPEAKVEIDHVAIVEALRSNDLPAVSTAAIVAAISEGKSLDEAVAAQVQLREAFTASTETGTVIRESANGKVTGLARAVTVLGS